MNITTTAHEKSEARFRRYASKRRKWPRRKSVRAVQGGLPSLGKRRRP